MWRDDEFIYAGMSVCGAKSLKSKTLQFRGYETVSTPTACPGAPQERYRRTLDRQRRRELLDRTLIWNQAHLRQILREYEIHHNRHRPHRSLHAAALLKPLPEPFDLEQCHGRRQARADGLIN